MPTLRDRTREALGHTEPDEREARRELANIVQRARTRERSRARIVFALGPIALAAGIAAFVVARRPAPSPPPVIASTGIHLHLHLEGEPLDKDITLDLTATGVR